MHSTSLAIVLESIHWLLFSPSFHSYTLNSSLFRVFLCFSLFFFVFISSKMASQLPSSCFSENFLKTVFKLNYPWPNTYISITCPYPLHSTSHRHVTYYYFFKKICFPLELKVHKNRNRLLELWTESVLTREFSIQQEFKKIYNQL